MARDLKFEHFKQPGVIEQRLRLKLRSNLITLLLCLAAFVGADGDRHRLVRRVHYALSRQTAIPWWSRARVSPSPGSSRSWQARCFSILCERAVRRFRPLQPQYCSLYDPAFWEHERFWKLNYNTFLRVFDGTPMKPVFVRLQGARIGRRVFDDGAGLTEPTLTEIGDYSTLNFGSTIQCHSLEDGTFKSDRVRLGRECHPARPAPSCTTPPKLRDGSTLDADAFLMKGTVMEERTSWRGNPAEDSEQAPTPRQLIVIPGEAP